ncbi:MAG: hypothetical protein JWN08_3248 [Frankiales bacterium]|jgi:hypothetical protein|nr:hypothetical protein [Frankiales bacterium]
MTPVGSSGATVVTTTIVVLCALLLLGLGVWGWRNAPSLAPAVLDAQERQLRSRMLRRGSAACAGAGACLLAAVVVGLSRR